MAYSPNKLNAFLMFNVPAAWLCGVRVKEVAPTYCKVRLRQNWLNKNPFKSIYFAVQAMAAELSTGVLVMAQIKKSGKNISMLVKQNNASFSKKATGRIIFECHNENEINLAIQKTLKTGKGQTFWMKSIGRNENGIEVSTFNFEWTIKLKK